jgi:adenylyl cyclase-associated protein
VSKFESAYDELIANQVTAFVNAASALGGKIAEMGQLFRSAFDVQRAFLRVAATHSAPASPAELGALLAPTSQKMEAMTALRESNRGDAFNALSVVSEGAMALAWVSEPKTPLSLVDEGANACKFYTNKIRTGNKGDEKYMTYISTFEGLLAALRDYVKEFHLTGVAWNKSGPAATKAALSSSTSTTSNAAPSAGGPPPPPPAPPADLYKDVGKQPTAGKGPDQGALFAELAKGEGITSGLKHVSKAERSQPPASSVVPATAPKPAAATATAGPKGKGPKGTPKLALEGSKWVVEFQVGRSEQPIEIQIDNMKQNVYLYGCVDTVVVVKGKCSMITIDACDKCGVVFDAIVSNVQIVNCNSLKLQAQGKVPSIVVDKTSGFMVYLSKESLDVELVTSKSSEMNVSIPVGEEGEFEEVPVPEQYVSKVVGKKLDTTPSQHTSA